MRWSGGAWGAGVRWRTRWPSPWWWCGRDDDGQRRGNGESGQKWLPNWNSDSQSGPNKSVKKEAGREETSIVDAKNTRVIYSNSLKKGLASVIVNVYSVALTSHARYQERKKKADSPANWNIASCLFQRKLTSVPQRICMEATMTKLNFFTCRVI